MTTLSTVRHDPDAPLPPLSRRLLRAQVGGCTCLTKTPELRYHDPQCTYRLAADALAEIERLSQLLRRAHRHHTATSLPLVIERYGSREAGAAEGAALWSQIVTALPSLPEHESAATATPTPPISAGNLPPAFDLRRADGSLPPPAAVGAQLVAAGLLSLDDDTPLARPQEGATCSLDPGCESCQ